MLQKRNQASCKCAYDEYRISFKIEMYDNSWFLGTVSPSVKRNEGLEDDKRVILSYCLHIFTFYSPLAASHTVRFLIYSKNR
jgi:hypothetical protein